MFFGKKKNSGVRANMPQIPQFSPSQQYAQRQQNTGPMQEKPQELAEYRESFKKKPQQLPRIEVPEVEQEEPVIDIPRREPAFMQKKRYPQREAYNDTQEGPMHKALMEMEGTIPPPQTIEMEEESEEEPAFVKPRTTPPKDAEIMDTKGMDIQLRRERPREIVEEKPVFVKLEQYRDAIANIEVIKQKIKETEYLIERIEELRTQEQVELGNCQNNINKLKEKLIGLDKKLFEV